jgi:putative nucleotidyltransferase with HDIG domain
MTVSPRELITGALDLPSLPEVVMRAIELVNDPEASAIDIGRVLSEDSALTARLLKIVNSPFYGFPSRIDTVSRAITVIGTLDLLDLILATSVVKMFSGVPNDLVSMDSFWKHSLYAGVVARLLAARSKQPNVEHFFVAGLLHDLGSLVIYRKLPELAREALLRARYNGVVLQQAEQELLGFDHAMVGAELMRMWKLPASLVEAVEFHHDPSQAPNHPLITAIVHVADVVASAIRSGTGASEAAPPLDPSAWDRIGLPPLAIEALLIEADRQFGDAQSMILDKHAA